MPENETDGNPFLIRAYTKKELRLLYEIPKATFRRWMDEVPETAVPDRKNWLTAVQVEAIIRTYGVPGQKQFHKTNY
jgi:hypothetical protein